MGILIQGGRIVDAATDTDKKGDIYLEDGVITEIGEKLKIKDKSDKMCIRDRFRQIRNLSVMMI